MLPPRRKRLLLLSLFAIGVLMMLMAVGMMRRREFVIGLSPTSELHVMFNLLGVGLFRVEEPTGRDLYPLMGDGYHKVSAGPTEMIRGVRVPYVFSYMHTAVPLKSGSRVEVAGAHVYYVLPVVLALLMPVIEGLRWLYRPLAGVVERIRCRRRELQQLSAGEKCPGCGYDLRASTNRCPECGLAFVRKTVIVATT